MHGPGAGAAAPQWRGLRFTLPVWAMMCLRGTRRTSGRMLLLFLSTWLLWSAPFTVRRILAVIMTST